MICGCVRRPDDAVQSDRLPSLMPELSATTFPSNIAAPTFKIKEEGEKYYVEIGKIGEEAAIGIGSVSGEIMPDLGEWHKLLERAKGDEIYIRVYAIKENAGAVRFKDIVCEVSEHQIDPYIAYRLLYPGYVLWDRMGIYQRNLADYTQEPILENKDIEHQCLNCHSFSGWSPERMMFHVRGKTGGTLIRRDGISKKVRPDIKSLGHGATYPAWHPGGRYIAFSANKVQQIFHSKGSKTTEVTDLASDMTVYDIEKDEALTAPWLSGAEWMETFPAWTPDGETLYFCRAKGYREGMRLDSIRYDLCKVGFDPSTREFGEVETVIPASGMGKSISFPRVSPDGRWLLFTMSDYGNFSIWHPEADLYLLDIAGGDFRPVDEVNSDNVESYHSWSSNGRWIIFSSKRGDGLWARPYIASFDPEKGVFGSPFILPQPSPAYYNDLMQTFNIPEFISGEVEDKEEFSRIILGS